MGLDGDAWSALDKYRVQSLPLGLFYITRFLSPEEELSLLDKVIVLMIELTSRSLTRDGLSCPIADFSLIHRH
jgi:hypothetical protein